MSTPRRKRPRTRSSALRAARDHARALTPRETVHDIVEGRAYPTAEELFTQDTAWRAYVRDAMRSLLAPAALAGAVSFAGCAGVGDASSGGVHGDTTTTQPSATLTPVGQPTPGTQPPHHGGDVVVTPIPPVTLTPLPPGTTVLRPTPTTTVAPVRPPHLPPLQPPTNAPMIRGQMRQVQPTVSPPQADGGHPQVRPIPPPLEPPPLGGAPPPVQPQPPPPPPPSPPAVPGGMRATLPDDVIITS